MEESGSEPRADHTHPRSYYSRAKVHETKAKDIKRVMRFCLRLGLVSAFLLAMTVALRRRNAGSSTSKKKMAQKAEQSTARPLHQPANLDLRERLFQLPLESSSVPTNWLQSIESASLCNRHCISSKVR